MSSEAGNSKAHIHHASPCFHTPLPLSSGSCLSSTTVFRVFDFRRLHTLTMDEEDIVGRGSADEALLSRKRAGSTAMQQPQSKRVNTPVGGASRSPNSGSSTAMTDSVSRSSNVNLTNSHSHSHTKKQQTLDGFFNAARQAVPITTVTPTDPFHLPIRSDVPEQLSTETILSTMDSPKTSSDVDHASDDEDGQSETSSMWEDIIDSGAMAGFIDEGE
jgi:hypothetical protein